MDNRKEMIDFALARMAGFTLEGSSDGDNRSIFSLVKTLIQSASGKTLAECRKPLAAVLSIRSRDPRDKFHGCKLTLLHQTIGTLFGGSKALLSDREFTDYDSDKLLAYLEVCRRIFIAKYASATVSINRSVKADDPVRETELQRAWRLAMERGKGRGGS